MDYEQDNQTIGPISQADDKITTKPKKRGVWKVIWGIFTGLSVLANVTLFIMLIFIIAAFATTKQKDFFTEDVIQAGSRKSKIAVITLQGFIDNAKADDIYKQLKTARRDKSVKAVILRVVSPGGAVAASDRIYKEILNFRADTDKPIVAFMQAVAASGGYYAAVACNEIIAEPTIITGSIGVIVNYFVIEELLEEKLGIQPVVIKSGEKKDWPSMFDPPSDEQKQYLQEKLIGPVYERFVQIVADSRKSLTLNDVKRLADGSIYNAAEALEEKLIDDIGYLADAIEKVSTLAGIKKPHVIEYRKPISLASFLSSGGKNSFKLDRNTLYELTTPQVLYLWNAY